MKKYLLFLTCILFLTTVGNAQYKINKTKYDYNMYQPQAGDPYWPGVAGVTSFLIPGLGQMIASEFGRGAAFLGGFVGCLALVGIGTEISLSDIEEGGDGSKGSGLQAIGSFGALAVDIWAVVDAIHVSKVNDMAFQDKHKTTLKIMPYINSSRYVSNSKAIPGLSLKVTF